MKAASDVERGGAAIPRRMPPTRVAGIDCPEPRNREGTYGVYQYKTRLTDQLPRWTSTSWLMLYVPPAGNDEVISMS